MKTWPLRTRLTLWSAFVTGLALLTFGVAAAVNLYRQEVETIDHRLNEHAKAFLDARTRGQAEELATLVHRRGEHLLGAAYIDAGGRIVCTEIKPVADLLTGIPPNRKRSTAHVAGYFVRLSVFTADASHELRTPLTIMRGQIEEALRNGPAAPETERLLMELLAETSGLQKIADNLLLLARFDIGKSPLCRTAFDCSGLIGEVCEDAELLATPRGIKTCATVEPGIRVDGDPVMLRRVALNLIDNAIKYNREGGEVRLVWSRQGREAVLAIGNSGAGIPAERRDALFKRFFRLNSDRNSTTGGSGLGLSLCREIVTAHGGRIELSRSESDWTEFSVTLPALLDVAGQGALDGRTTAGDRAGPR